MLTRAKKKQKIAEETLHVMVCIFPSLAPFLGVNDLTNLGMLCKELRDAVARERTSSWQFHKEERRPTLIKFEKKRFDLEPHFPRDEVTVSQVRSFRFWVSQETFNPNKLEVFVHIDNELWEEIDNRKVRDLQEPTGLMFFMHAHDGGEMVFDSVRNLELNDISFSSMSNCSLRYGLFFEYFQENAPEVHKNKLRRFLDILYACTKRIASWSDNDHHGGVYPPAEYLMRLLPEAVWPFFPKDFDWEANHSDRETVPEFMYHPAPEMEAWLSLIPDDDDLGIGNCWHVDSIPWYS